MGLRAAVSIFGKTEEGIEVWVRFTHQDEQLFYDTGEYEREYPVNSIGDLNGFGNISKPVGNIETLLTFIQSQKLK